jgi:hypothetical protein
LIAAAATANHSRGAGATHLGAEVVGAVAAGVIGGSPASLLFDGRGDL